MGRLIHKMFGWDQHIYISREALELICAKTGNNGLIQIFQRAPNRPPPHFLVTKQRVLSQQSHPVLNWWLFGPFILIKVYFQGKTFLRATMPSTSPMVQKRASVHVKNATVPVELVNCSSWLKMYRDWKRTSRTLTFSPIKLRTNHGNHRRQSLS
jgi:hypothetical protein